MAAIWHVFLLAVAIFVVAKILPGVRYKNLISLIVVALVYSLLNAVASILGPVGFDRLSLQNLLSISAIFRLAFFFIGNAFLLWVTDKLIKGFEIDGFKTTLIAAVLITVLNLILRVIL